MASRRRGGGSPRRLEGSGALAVATACVTCMAEAWVEQKVTRPSGELHDQLRDAAHADIMRERETANATPDAAQIKAVIVEEMKGKLKAKEAKLLLQFEAKSKQASDLIKKAETGAEEARHHLQRADEREQEAVARAETRTSDSMRGVNGARHLPPAIPHASAHARALELAATGGRRTDSDVGGRRTAGRRAHAAARRARAHLLHGHRAVRARQTLTLVPRPLRC